MNRQELRIKFSAFVRDANIDPSQIWIGAGGALLLHGLREATSDIDAGCTLSTYTRISLVLGGHLKASETGGDPLLAFPAYDLDLDLQPMKPMDMVVIDGIQCYGLRMLLAQKLSMNRPKDQADIQNLRKALGIM
jgi:hypothetical protein